MSNIKGKFLKIAVKVLFWILLLSMPFPFQTAMVEASNETVVKVEPHVSFARVGEQFTINITVVNVQNLYGVEVNLYWNASILEMVNADVRLGVEDHPDGVLYNPVSIVQNQTFQQQGKYVVAGLSAAEPPLPPSFNGSGNIVRVTFNVTGVGRCELSLEAKLASNIIPPGSTTVAPITHTTINGFFGPIQITAFPKRVTVGENVNISGFIAPAQANIPVTISYRRDEETEWHTLEIVETDEQGSYLYTWAPEKSGKYYVKSMAVIFGNEETSPIISISVNEPEQPPWLYIGVLVAIAIVVMVTLLMYRRRSQK